MSRRIFTAHCLADSPDPKRHRRATHQRALTWAVSVLMTLGLITLPAPDAHTQRPPRPVVCTPGDKGDVNCDLALESFFDAPVRDKLRSGFLNRFIYRIYIRRAKDGEPVSVAVMRLLEVYELWDEVYYVFSEDGEVVSLKSTGINEAVRHLASHQKLPVAQTLPPGRYYADVFVELNPLSEEEEAEIRSWIARSRGGQATFATGDRSFFGTFVSIFTNIKPGKAERTFRVQTAPFIVNQPAPRGEP